MHMGLMVKSKVLGGDVAVNPADLTRFRVFWESTIQISDSVAIKDANAAFAKQLQA